MRLRLGGVHEIGKLHGILDEEHGDVVANEIPVTFVRVELHREAADVPGGIGGAAFAKDGREADEDRCLFPGLSKE